MSDTVIIYGGSGFLGSHVADTLSNAGFRVRIFDLIPSPYLKDSQEMIQGNITDLARVVSAARGCRYVFNFAAIADIDDAHDHPVETTLINVLGNTHTLEAARLCKAERFLLASTVYVFSEAGSFYRASKQAAEQFVESYGTRYQLPYTILRYGSLYGPRANERNGIYRIIKQALEERLISYSGSGEEMREYIHVQDAARLTLQALGSDYSGRNLIVTGQERMSIKTLLKMISEMVPGGVETTFENRPLGGHYVMSPYSFVPQKSLKLTSNEHIDIGQGILECLYELYGMQQTSAIKEFSQKYDLSHHRPR